MTRGPKQRYRGRFSGWQYDNARSLGWTTYEPRGDDVELARAILRVYRNHDVDANGPLGPRGCGYIIEGQTIAGRRVVKGNEVAGGAKRLRAHFGGPVFTFVDIGEMIVALRRTLVDEWHLPDEWVEDGRTSVSRPYVAANMLDRLRDHACAMAPDLLAEQHVAVELTVEAQGGIGFWSTVAHRWAVPVYSGRGMNAAPFDLANRIAYRWHRQRKRTLVVLIGDHDPAGYVIPERLAEDVDRLVLGYQGMGEPKGMPSWVRLGLDKARADALSLSRTGKKSSHGRTLDDCAEAEAWTATAPDDARDAFDALMGEWLDLDKIEEARDAWGSQRRDALDRLADHDDDAS